MSNAPLNIIPTDRVAISDVHRLTKVVGPIELFVTDFSVELNVVCGDDGLTVGGAVDISGRAVKLCKPLFLDIIIIQSQNRTPPTKVGTNAKIIKYE